VSSFSSVADLHPLAQPTLQRQPNFSVLHYYRWSYGATPDDPCLPLVSLTEFLQNSIFAIGIPLADFIQWEAGEGPYIQGPLGALLWKSTLAALNERDFMAFPLAAGSFQGYWPEQTVNVVPGLAQSNFDFTLVKIHTHSGSFTNID
jgi:choline dehydrogenase